MNSLIINSGSSSIKFRLYQNSKIILDGVVDGLGIHNDVSLIYQLSGKENNIIVKNVKTSKQAIDIILSLINFEAKVNPSTINKIAYRVVHGKNLKSPIELTPSVIKELESIIPLAPLHLPRSLEIIKYLQSKIKAKHLAVFDNAFHNTMPAVSKLYALPLKLSEKYDVKRYGFHGLAHEWLAHQAQKNSKTKLSKIITCQLGNGASICAIENGKSIDTTMGFTPLEGLMMGTRSGNVDPGLVLFLSEKLGIKETKRILEKESGLKGMAGESDMRSLLHREKKGDKKASLAINLFCYQVKKQIGAYIAALGGVDAIVLGGGLSRSDRIRCLSLHGLDNFGIQLDKKYIKNQSGLITNPKSKVKVYFFETDEQDQIFQLTK